MKRTVLLVATLATVGLAGCSKEAPKPAPAPAILITPAPAPAPTAVPGPTDAAKDATKTSTEAPKVEAPKTEAAKDAKK
jgi:hypothetical protein